MLMRRWLIDARGDKGPTNRKAIELASVCQDCDWTAVFGTGFASTGYGYAALGYTPHYWTCNFNNVVLF